MIELNKIKLEHPELIVCFDFLERLTKKLIDISLLVKKENCILFVDYRSEFEYFVPWEEANNILDYYYNEFYFKVVMSGSEFYNQVQETCEDIDPQIFDLFFRSLFVAAKNRIKCNKPFNRAFNKKEVRLIVTRAYQLSFKFIPSKINETLYIEQYKIMLDRLEKKGLISYDSNDIIKNERFKSYFPTSCDTFKFINLEFDEPGYDSCISGMFEYIDLTKYLQNQDYLNKDLLTIIDRAIQVMIVICFKDAKYVDNEYSDNSYIKQLHKIKRRKVKYIQCVKSH